MKRNEVNKDEAIAISNEIGEIFSHYTSDTIDFDKIYSQIETKHGKGSIILALRDLVGWYVRERKYNSLFK